MSRGRTVGDFRVEGESEKGQVTVPRSPEFSSVLRDASEQVASESLPVEMKQIVEQYYDSLLRGGAVRSRAVDGGGDGNGAGG